MDQSWTKTQMYYQRFEMGSPSPSWIVQKESILCLVWCSHRLHFDHCQSPRWWLFKMVEKSRTSSALSIYGQRQRTFPYCHVPFELDRCKQGLDLTSPHFHNLISKLRIRQIFQEKWDWSFRWFCDWNWYSFWSLEILFACQSTREIRLLILLGWLCPKK